jgi:DNA polymerase-3 subunit delta'
MMLQTILSRCQPVRFEPLTEHDLASALVERDAVERPKALLIARLANGSYTRARELLDTDIAELRNDVVTFIRHCLANNVVNLSQHIEKLSAEKDREFIVRYLLLMLMWFRDAFALLRGGDVINIDQQDDLKKFTTRFPHARLGEAMASVEHCISLIYKNGYIPLALTQLAVKLKRAIEEDR